MSKSINLIFGCHSHQPVGNFDHVFRDAYERAYRPFVEVHERFPAVKVTHHYSGPLLDWFEAQEPAFLDRLAAMVQDGQVEIMGGGYYEPLLCAIPERDSIAQIERMNAFCVKHFGKRPTGMWLAERVWEPHMPRSLKQAGIEYTALDDTHFLCSGLMPDHLFGSYVTEDEGHSIKAFPILAKLRYLIPFHPVQETIDFLRQHATEDGTRCAVIHDDGEKFGMWPGTHDSVYGEGWLERFFEALTENRDWLKSLTYSEYSAKNPPLGRTYLTCASYHEMMAWALPTEMQRRMKRVEEQIRENPERADEQMLFIRGGFWRNFLAKYDESNNIQKKMLRVSKRLEDLTRTHASAKGDGDTVSAALAQAAKLLHQGQCNCAYWHGVFGGLYLNHLRTALYEKLIEAECVMDRIEYEDEKWVLCDVLDFDADGLDEVLLENAAMSLALSPSAGGTLFEWDYKARPFNFCSILTRREEPYHDELRKGTAQVSETDGSEGSIHEMSQAKEAGLDSLLVYDRYRRVSLRDHFLPMDTTVEQLWDGTFTELGDFDTGIYRFDLPAGRSLGREPVVFEMWRDGIVRCEQESAVGIRKTVTINPCASIFEIRYDIQNKSPQAVSALFGTELIVNMLTGSAPDRYYRSDDREMGSPMLGEAACDEGIGHIALRDEWMGVECAFAFNIPVRLYRFALETVSQSESGQERVYQGSVLVPCWHLELEPGAKRQCGIRASITIV